MPGLVGIVSSQNDIIDIEKILSKFCQAIKHENWHKIDTHVKKNVGFGKVHLGILNPEPQPIFNEDKSLCIMMDGEVYDYLDLKKKLISKGHKFSVDNDPEFILHLYEEYGRQFVHKINGSFTLAIWNEELHELLLVNDRYGLRPIYYTKRDGYLLFGSEVKAILEDETFKKIVNKKSIADFFSFGYILGNKTFFQGIELLPPASIMTYSNDKVSIEQYWDFEFNEVYEDYPIEYYIEKLSKLVLQAVERCMKGDHRIGIPLSGGLDSRTIAASIQKSHYPIHSFTFGKPNCYDVKYAKMISNKLGLIHHFFNFKPDDLVSYAQKAVYLTDGMQNCIHAHRMQTYNETRNVMDIALGGWIGDSTIALHGPLDDYSEDCLENFKYIINPVSMDLVKNLFNDDYIPVIEQNFIDTQNNILQINDNLDIKLPSNNLQYFNLKIRQHRFTLMGHVLMRNSLEVRTPFSDYDFIDFNLNIPPVLKSDLYLYIKLILEMFPQLSNVPGQKSGMLLDARCKHKVANIIRLKRKINKFSKYLGIELFNNPSNFHEYDKWMRKNTELRKYIFSILTDERTLKRSYFNQETVKNILDQHMSGKEDHSEMIGRLLTFELWNRLFIDE